MSINLHIVENIKNHTAQGRNVFDSLVMLNYNRAFHSSTTCNLILCDKTATLIN